MEINPEFSELLAYTQVLNSAINPKSQELRGVCVGYESLNPHDFVKNGQKRAHTPLENSAIKVKSQKKKPVCDEILVEKARVLNLIDIVVSCDLGSGVSHEESSHFLLTHK